MASLLARIGRFEAPVEYQGIYPWFQRVRAIAAVLVAAGSTVALLAGTRSALIPISLAAVVFLHARRRIYREHSPIEFLVIDALAIGFGFGAGAHAHTGLVAVIAYLIAASITFAGLTALMVSLGTFGVTVLVRPLIPMPGPPDSDAGELLSWVPVPVMIGGVALSLMAAAREVYKARQVQAKALATERRASEMKNEFVSMITHELRTPLTNIAGFSDTLYDTWRDLPPDDVDEFLRIVVSESEHLKGLVEDVLTIPRLEAGRLALDPIDFDLRPTVYKVVDLLFPESEEKTISVTMEGSIEVHADPSRAEQVLRNLVENARKYGGRTVHLEAARLADEWKLTVADDGAGVPPEARDRVFEVFQQATSGDARSESGFGVGLTVARHLVEAMSGRIWYEPGPPGARFCFTLPVAQGAAGTLRRAEVA